MLHRMKHLKTLPFVAVALSLAFIFSGCNNAQKYEQNRLAADKWLSEQSASSSLQVGGLWDAADWGVTKFTQSGKNVTGTIGQFNVKGVVSGSKLFLAISEDGWVYYTAILERSSASMLTGSYSYTVPFSTKDKRPMVLKRF